MIKYFQLKAFYYCIVLVLERRLLQLLGWGVYKTQPAWAIAISAQLIMFKIITVEVTWSLVKWGAFFCDYWIVIFQTFALIKLDQSHPLLGLSGYWVDTRGRLRPCQPSPTNINVFQLFNSDHWPPSWVPDNPCASWGTPWCGSSGLPGSARRRSGACTRVSGVREEREQLWVKSAAVSSQNSSQQ